MADSKIDFSFENLHFACEGENDWVEKQLNNILNRIPAILAVHKKGENIVEEVIEVSEEVVGDSSDNEPIATKKSGKSPKVKKPVVAKVPKTKIPREKKVKTPKVSKAEVASEGEATAVGNVVKRGRKPKEGSKAVAKKKVSRKRIAKVRQTAELSDSPIAQFIAEKKATENQVRKFLATAVFLSKSNNISKLSTPMISKILKSYGIEKLQNASDCLNKNEKKGYCIKDGKEFVITENGYLSIG